MHYKSIFIKTVLIFYIALGITNVSAVTDRDQFKRIHDRIAGIHPDEQTLQAMETACTTGYVDDNGINHPGGAVGSAECYEAAAYVAIDNPRFYNVTLKNMVTPWTNEAQSIFDPLNDYTATVIGIVRDNEDFRKILTDDILYTVGNGSSNISPNPTALPPGVTSTYSPSNNNHYKQAEDNDIDLKATLSRTLQSSAQTLGIPSNAAAGVMTTRAAAKAFFVDGTNRAMFRFTILNHFCNDLEFYKDVTRPADRIRQDVSRSPGGDSRIYLNNCIGCHSGMDPLAGAFAYYQYQYDPNTDPQAQNGQLIYTAGNVQPKHLINADNFKWGYPTVDESWINYWRKGPNVNIGWDQGLTGSGTGASSLGQELANTDAFASCQVKKVFQTVCLRSPVDQTDRNQVDAMAATFKGGYNLKQTFSEAASYCLIPTP